MTTTDTPLATQIAELTLRIGLLEDESAIRRVLARYGFYADFGMLEEWLDLFTDDIVFDNFRYVGGDPYTSDGSQFRRFTLVGKDQISTGMLLSPEHKSVEGHCQHHMDGTPAVIEIIDQANAVARSYAVVYAGRPNEFGPTIAVQFHSSNRWRFRKEDGHWRIKECLRRIMGSRQSHLFLTDVALDEVPIA